MTRPGTLTAMISSTAADLPDHRKHVVEACLREGVFPISMEHLPAQDATGVQASLDMVDNADIYIGIYAWRYGWVPEPNNPDQISITEMEFNRAVERQTQGLLKEIVIFLMHEDHPIVARDKEDGIDVQEKLKRFKDRAVMGRVRSQFTSAEELRGHVIQSLGRIKRKLDDIGPTEVSPQSFHPDNVIPIPPDQYIAHPYTLLQTKDVIGRQAELNLLTDWVTTNEFVPKDVRIFNVVAIGGMGKSALTWKWYNDIAPNEIPQFAGRMWWSFYESDATFDNFVVRSLAYVSGRPETDVRRLSPPEREEQLFQILDKMPFLIVLDGLERLLMAYARMDAARLPDEDLDERTANAITETQDLTTDSGKTFAERHRLRQCSHVKAGQMLRRLGKVRASRLLVSTRLFPADLQSETGELLPGCFAKFLTGLPDDDALNLWRAFGVSGTREKLVPIFKSFGNYPLLIRALAGEVAAFRPSPGDFDKWLQSKPHFNPIKLPLKNARTHVLRIAFEGLTAAQHGVLSIISGFRMPVTWETLRAVVVRMCHEESSAQRRKDSGAPLLQVRNTSESIESPVVFTEWLQQRYDTNLDTALTTLEDRGLLGWDKQSNRYDLHPIVRLVAWDRTHVDVRNRIFQNLIAHIGANTETARSVSAISVDELTSDVEVYCALIALGRAKNAFRLFRTRLDEPTLFVVSALRLRIELLELLFPNGIESQSILQSPRDEMRARLWIATTYHLLGEPAVPLRLLADSDAEPNAFFSFSYERWRGFSHSAWQCGKLRDAERAMWNAQKMELDPKLGFIRHIHWFMYFLAARGVFVEILPVDRLVEPNSPRGLRKWVLICCLKAQARLWQDRPNEALEILTSAAVMLVGSDRKREPIRLNRLRGTAYLHLGEFDHAKEYLEQAIAGARSINLIEEEIPAITALAEVHRRGFGYRTARELLEQVWLPAERGPFPLLHADALNVLAQIERDEGNLDAATAAAIRAYTFAWCDGPPYAYSPGMEGARKLLRELGGVEPQLVPFSEELHASMPDIVREIENACK